MKTILTTLFLIIIAFNFLSCNSSQKDEFIYLTEIRKDFIKHKTDVENIHKINSGIVKRIDSLLNGQRKDTLNSDLVKGIMYTVPYDLTILAYRDILNGYYINDANLKLKIATHIAKFEGMAQSKRGWDQQWDDTARPYLYNNGLLTSNKKNNLISDPVFLSVLFDRRMFAHDVEYITPSIIKSSDSVILTIDELLKR
ncbi:MAG: hypothetical protein WA839_15300 [Flavobacteriaceae bacterium]|tara:strand:+ start:7621 stop:8214 length:594 start_codon:yes stop_codon:yes gene_type:complete